MVVSRVVEGLEPKGRWAGRAVSFRRDAFCARLNLVQSGFLAFSLDRDCYLQIGGVSNRRVVQLKSVLNNFILVALFLNPSAAVAGA